MNDDRELRELVEGFRDACQKLRSCLSSEYCITRTDGTMMMFADVMIISSIFDRLDEFIDESENGDADGE